MMCNDENIDKHIKLIESGIEKTRRQAYQEILKNEYVDLLKEQVELEKQEENRMRSVERILDKNQDLAYQELAEKTNKLRSELVILKRELHELNENFDNLTIRSTVQKEHKKKEEEESINQLKVLYLAESKQLNATLKQTEQECEKIERERQQHIQREKNTRESSLAEIKGHLQRQIFDRNGEFFQAQQKNKELRKQVEELKKEINRQQDVQTVRFQNTRPFTVNYMETNNKPADDHDDVQFKDLYNTRFADEKQENVSIMCDGPDFDFEEVDAVIHADNKDFIRIDEDQIELLKDKEFDFAES
ncbi:coiled-coil domain-containing protein 39-like isoform X2 [Anthonomus grandis grandis]|uniref:coiled-coil domain-containing protein 39-like isoform X2 n=1 Tax=Anthonomus grandis grandis TaxID=2921223 RepID=UPI002164F4DE|nr:coiled-coil domain-containing protein 39-like isoform X2 [Anthonomus grandis grandis]